MQATKKRSPLTVIILAAGKGTRMKSALPKVMHKIAGRPMIAHVLATAISLKPEKIITVLAPGMESVEETVLALHEDTQIVIQEEQLGTGHAVRCAEVQLKGFDGNLLILYGDTPLLQRDILQFMLKQLEVKKQPGLVVLGMRPDDPGHYGRMVVNEKGGLERIVEYVDATASEKKIRLCNSGVIAARAKPLFSLLAKMKNNNAKGEYYITDIVPAARSVGISCTYAEAPAHNLAGVNSREQLAKAEHIMQDRLRRHAMAEGVTLVEPESVHLSYDTRFGRDVVIQPNVFFAPSVRVGSNVEIRSFCHLAGASIGDHTVIGPFARLRPGAEVESGARIGNFVEIKQANIGKDARINHLSYIGDATVGKNANVGAGTITCNYDGRKKHRTVIGEGAFIGSNTALVAPVTIGKHATVGAGSTITDDVEDNALALTRPLMVKKKGWVKKGSEKKK